MSDDLRDAVRYEAKDGRAVWICPEHISHLEDYRHEPNLTTLYFSDGRFTEVTGDPASTMVKLK